MGRRLASCGGRDFQDKALVYRTLDDLDPDVVIVGDADGSDKLTREWAAERGVPLMVFPAHWDYYGKSAGPQRNAYMLKYGDPDTLVAFPGGRGTADMIRRCTSACLDIRRVSEPQGEQR